MKRRYRIKIIEYGGYIPQVKYGWLPWVMVGTHVLGTKRRAIEACDKHNSRKFRKYGVLEVGSFEYTPKPPAK